MYIDVTPALEVERLFLVDPQVKGKKKFKAAQKINGNEEATENTIDKMPNHPE